MPGKRNSYRLIIRPRSILITREFCKCFSRLDSFRLSILPGVKAEGGGWGRGGGNGGRGSGWWPERSAAGRKVVTDVRIDGRPGPTGPFDPAAHRIQSLECQSLPLTHINAI